MVEMKAKRVNADELKFDEKGLIAAIAQDYESGEVLMQAFMNREAVEKTFETGVRALLQPFAGVALEKGRNERQHPKGDHGVSRLR